MELSKKDLSKGLKIPQKLSPKLAYLSGILVGDGGIYQRKDKNEYTIKCVGNPKDEQKLYHQIIGPYFKEVFGFAPKMKLHDSNTTFGFVIHSKTLLTYLTQIIGLSEGRKNNNLCIPKPFKENLTRSIPFLRGLFDTDGCITFKKRYRSVPYYPVISLSSQSKKLIEEVAGILKELEFKVVEMYDYHVIDNRAKQGFTVINRIELNGKDNLRRWMNVILFSSPKHLQKIKNWEEI